MCTSAPVETSECEPGGAESSDGVTVAPPLATRTGTERGDTEGSKLRRRNLLARMSNELRKQAHDLDVTVWVGKNGIDAVVDELKDQLQETKLVKIKFLRAARGTDDTKTLAAKLAEKVNAELIETRGHTAVLH
jgi:RNA-binding protein